MNTHRLVVAGLAVAALGLMAVSVVFFGSGAETAGAQAYSAISNVAVAPQPPTTNSGFLGQDSASSIQLSLFAIAVLLAVAGLAYRFRGRFHR